MAEDTVAVGSAEATGGVVPGGFAASVAVVNPKRHEWHVGYVALRELTMSSPDGSTRRLLPGDVLSGAEARHAGSALARMAASGLVAELPATSGLLGIVDALVERVRRVEGLAVDALLTSPAALASARETKVSKTVAGDGS